MAEWLRPVFGRARPSVSSFVDLNNVEPSTEAEESEKGRLKSSSRVASYISYKSNAPPPYVKGEFPKYNPALVYHAPSGDQMADMLKVAVMGHSSFDPLPVEYNSCIIHVLEAYYAQKEEITKRDKLIEAADQKHESAIKGYEDLAIAWEEKEIGYRSEIKKLEVLLSRTAGGMEKVTLARTKSKVHGSGKIREAMTDLSRAEQEGKGITNSTEVMIGPLPHTDEEPLYIRPGGLSLSRYKNKQTQAVDSMQHKVPDASYDSQADVQRPSLNTRISAGSSGHSSTTTAPSSQNNAPEGSNRQGTAGSDRHLRSLKSELSSDDGSSDSSAETIHARRRSLSSPTYPTVATGVFPSSSQISPVRGRFAKLKRVFGDNPASRTTHQIGLSFVEGDESSFLSHRRSIDLHKPLGKSRLSQAAGSGHTPHIGTREDTMSTPRPGTVKRRSRTDSTMRFAEEPRTSTERAPRHPVSTIQPNSSRVGSESSQASTSRSVVSDKSAGSKDAVAAAVLAVARTSRAGSDEQNHRASGSSSDVSYQTATAKRA